MAGRAIIGELSSMSIAVAIDTGCSQTEKCSLRINVGVLLNQIPPDIFLLMTTSALGFPVIPFELETGFPMVEFPHP